MRTGKNNFINHLPLSAFIRVYLRLTLTLFFLSVSLIAQPKIAVVAPDKTARSIDFAERFAESFAADVKVLDNSLSDAAFAAQNFDQPFNLSTTEAKNAGAAAGADYLLLVKSENQRRASLSKGDFYESYAAIFVVNSRSGALVFWKLASFEAAASIDAERKLFDSTNDLTAEIVAKLKTDAAELRAKTESRFERPPPEDSPAAKEFRPPLPFKRLRPEYTSLARLYAVEATVDAEFDVDETGKISNVRIVRWAGYGLDESVAANILKMNWRAAERAGKFVPVRVLVRYNFKKIEAE